MPRTTIRTEDITASEVTTAKMAVDPTNASNLSSGSVPAAQLGNVDTTGLEDDIALLGFKVAANGSLAKYNLVDQTIDNFEDSSGIDATLSLNEVLLNGVITGASGGNYFGDASLGDCTFGASSITQSSHVTAIDTVLGTGSASGGPGNNSYGFQGSNTSTVDGIPNPTAVYELNVTSGTGSITSYSGSTNGGAINADGDMVVAQFNDLTIDASTTLTTKHPCRGLFVYVAGDCVINGALSMKSRGPSANPTTSGGSDSNSVQANGLQLGLQTSGGSTSFTNDGTAFNGAGSSIRSIISAHQANLSSDGTVFTMSLAGGAGSAGNSSGSASAGTAGATGAVTISSGGGAGGSGTGGAGNGSAGFVFGGGSGGGAGSGGTGGMNAADYGGQGGRGYTNNGGLISTGGGNPGGNQDSDGGSPQRAGDGNGGIIWLVVGGDLTIGASGIITAQGNNSWPGADGAGGATGGGAIHALHAGTLTNNGSITAAGGTESATRGAAGGAGGVNTTLVSPKTYADLTLVSTATTAVQAADPTKGDIVFTYTNETGTATLNTDLKAYVSRDNGTTYTQGTLESQGTTGGHTIVTFHDLDISSQPSGAAMRYKITTHNQSASKETGIQAVSLGWS